MARWTPVAPLALSVRRKSSLLRGAVNSFVFVLVAFLASLSSGWNTVEAQLPEFLFNVGCSILPCDGTFNSPRSLAVDSAGRIIVVDALNSRVQVFGPTGAFFFKFGSLGNADGEFSLEDSVGTTRTSRDLGATRLSSSPDTASLCG